MIKLNLMGPPKKNQKIFYDIYSEIVENKKCKVEMRVGFKITSVHSFVHNIIDIFNIEAFDKAKLKIGAIAASTFIHATVEHYEKAKDGLKKGNAVKIEVVNRVKDKIDYNICI